MTKYTDKTIPITCFECLDDHNEIGLGAMVLHIQMEHENQYPTLRLATAIAEDWMEEAYDQADRFEEDYLNNQNLVRAIRKNTGEY